MAEKKYRSRVHMVLLYPDYEEHMNALQVVKKSFDYACIFHNQDVTDDGELKKPHYHVIIRTQNATWNSSICKELGIESRFTEQVRNMDNSLLYLLHFNEPYKHQYDMSEVEGPLKSRLKSAINNQNKNEDEKVGDLLEQIKNTEGYISITSFATFCSKNGYWGDFRRSATIFLKIIEEHNAKFRK